MTTITKTALLYVLKRSRACQSVQHCCARDILQFNLESRWMKTFYKYVIYLRKYYTYVNIIYIIYASEYVNNAARVAAVLLHVCMDFAPQHLRPVGEGITLRSRGQDINDRVARVQKNTPLTCKNYLFIFLNQNEF